MNENNILVALKHLVSAGGEGAGKVGGGGGAAKHSVFPL